MGTRDRAQETYYKHMPVPGLIGESVVQGAVFGRPKTDEHVMQCAFPRRDGSSKLINFYKSEVVWWTEHVPLFAVLVKKKEDIQNYLEGIRSVQNIANFMLLHGSIFTPSGVLNEGAPSQVVMMRTDEQDWSWPSACESNPLLVCIYGTVLRRLDGQLDADVVSGGIFSRHAVGDTPEDCIMFLASAREGGRNLVKIKFINVSPSHQSVTAYLQRFYSGSLDDLPQSSSSFIRSVIVKQHCCRLPSIKSLFQFKCCDMSFALPISLTETQPDFRHLHMKAQDVFADTGDDNVMACDFESDVQVQVVEPWYHEMQIDMGPNYPISVFQTALMQAYPRAQNKEEDMDIYLNS